MSQGPVALFHVDNSVRIVLPHPSPPFSARLGLLAFPHHLFCSPEVLQEPILSAGKVMQS